MTRRRQALRSFRSILVCEAVTAWNEEIADVDALDLLQKLASRLKLLDDAEMDVRPAAGGTVAVACMVSPARSRT